MCVYIYIYNIVFARYLTRMSRRSRNYESTKLEEDLGYVSQTHVGSRVSGFGFRV